MTPLHLAIKSAESFQTTRAIKELLIKGGDRKARDREGRLPVDLTVNIKSQSMRNEVRDILVSYISFIVLAKKEQMYGSISYKITVEKT